MPVAKFRATAHAGPKRTYRVGPCRASQGTAMATITLYRPIGTAELDLIERDSWRAFPPMPNGHKFYAYLQPPTDVLEWKHRSVVEIPEEGQDDVVRSWDAWGNSPTPAFVVAFELDERSPLGRSAWGDRSYSVDEVNAALVGPISLHGTMR